MSDPERSVTWHSRLRWFSGQVGINVLAGWVGALFLAGLGWLKSPTHWQTFIGLAGSAGVVVGVVVFVLSLRWKQLLAISALCLGFAGCLFGVSLLRHAFGAGSVGGLVLAVLMALQGFAGFMMGVQMVRERHS